MPTNPDNTVTVSALERAKQNCARLILQVQEVIANPTQANIDAIVAAADGTGLLVPKPSYSLDGESYDWPGYVDRLLETMDKLQALIVKLAGNFIVRSRGTTGCP